MTVIRFEAFEVDDRAGELRRHGKRIRLQQQPFRILALLLEHPGQVVTRDELRRAIWPTLEFGGFDESLDAAVYKLRTALGDSAEHPTLIETLPRRGYRFIGSLETPAEPSVPKRKSLVWIVGLVVLAAFFSAAGLLHLPGRLLGRPASPRIQSIVVLPLRNLSGDFAQDFFAEGITEALTTRLGQTAGLRVISFTSAMHYKDTRERLPDIGRELNVDAVIEGGVVQSQNRVRVTAQLIQVSSDRHLWAETYERDLRDMLSLQDAIATAVTNEVRSRLSPSEPVAVPSARTRPVDPDAYELYLRGRAKWNERTLSGLREGIEYFEQALHEDSTYAPAWGGVADGYAGLGSYNFLAPKVAWPQARIAALKAIQLDQTLSDPHVTLALELLHLELSWSDAESEFRRAIALNPNNAFAHQAYGSLLNGRGQFDEAIAEMRRAVELDPLSPNWQTALGFTLFRAGRYDDALRILRDVPEGAADSPRRHWRIAVIYERQGRQKDALTELLTILKLRGRGDVAASVDRDYRSFGYAHAKRTFLRADLLEARRRARDSYPRPLLSDVAADYALLGQTDSAFDWLSRALQDREWSLTTLTVDDRFESLHADPRFRKLAHQIGLPDIAER
jgi:TolB-like protein/DNA-binding winged helix-turn-helix (wHTH) protein/Tfp pilus assembly protein PilF